MALYSVTLDNVTPTAGNDLMTLIPPATRFCRLQMVEIAGLGTVSSSFRYLVAKSTVGTTPGGAQTPAKRQENIPAAATVVDTTWAAQPTLGDVVVRPAVNANGAMYRLGPIFSDPGIVTVINANQISIRCVAAGTGALNITVWFEE